MGAEVRAAMFFAGLILLIPHRIGMSRVNYIIKRYNLPISRAGLLLYKYHNNIELSLFIGNLVGFASSFNITSGNHLRWSLVGICSLMLISSIILFIIYILGGDFGHLNAFYFSLIFTTLCDGATNPFAFGCNATNSSLYAAAIPISGFLVTLFHYIYKFIFDIFHWDDFDYYVLFLQLLYNTFIITATIILWAISKYTTGSKFNGWELDNSANNSSDWLLLFDTSANGHAADWSPIGMLAFSLGTVYAFYPSIAPYSIIDFQYASIIELWILIISSSPTFLFALLDLIDFNKGSGHTATLIIGPGQVRSKATGNYWIGNWSWYETSKPIYHLFWHCIWICAIPYILCIQIFMSMLHYPHSSLSSFFNNNPLRIGFISVLFNFLREAMQAGGFAGAGKQRTANKEEGASATKGQNIKGTIAATNKPITLFVMMFCVFTGDGYLQHYRRCCRDNWPTTGYNKYQSFFYWLHFGFKGGIKSITSSFTDLYYHNLRPQFISYA